MYCSLQYITFTSCNVVLPRIKLYCNIGQRIKDSVVHRSYARLTVVAELYCWGSPILGIGMACQKLRRQGRDDAKSKAPSLHLFTL